MVWAAIAAQVAPILLISGVVGAEIGALVTAIIAGMLALGVLAGILNDPADAKNF